MRRCQKCDLTQELLLKCIFAKSLRDSPNRGYNEPFRLEQIWHDIFLVARKEIVACT